MGLPLPSQDHHKALSPIETHFRPATCLEVGCKDWSNGWDTIIASDDERRLRYIRHDAGRRYMETQVGEGLIRFRFPPEQTCFRAYDHKIKLERDPFFIKNETRMESDRWMDNISEGLYRGNRIIRRG